MDSPKSKSNQTDSFDSDAAWDFLSDLIDDFCTRWESTPQGPEINSFAKRLQQIDNAEFRRIGLIELVKVEFEFRSKQTTLWRDLDWYMNALPELGPANSPPSELVNEARRLGPDASGDDQSLTLACEVSSGIFTSSVFRSRNVHQLQPGDSIDDFDLLARLGCGAFATVFLARQLSMQRLVALKVSADEGLEGPTLAKLNHPHIVRVFDQRILPEQSLRLMYMEHVPGGSLSDVIKFAKADGKRLSSGLFLETLDQRLAEAGNSPPVESVNRESLLKADWPTAVARMGAQLAGAIDYTHSEGVLHRDIKPANVLIDEHGYPKLVDFNISFGNSVIGATAASCFGGSMAYMSPEQLEALHPQHPRTADQIDSRCDVYSLGITLYELLLGERPFLKGDTSNPLELIDQLAAERKNGLGGQQIRTLHEKNWLLGSAIVEALSPNVDSRPSVSVLQRQMQWAADEDICGYLKPAKFSWSNWTEAISKFPWVFILAFVFGVSIFATWFIIEYNVIESVQPDDQQLFLEARQMINRTAYPLGFVLLVGLFWRTWRLLRQKDRPLAEEEFKRTLESNLNFGNMAAILYAAIWTAAGMLYPIVLFAKGAEISSKAWMDFTLSHFIAGLVCGAFVFFGITLLSVVAWHPRLMMAALKQGVFVDVKDAIHKLRSRIYFYRVLAIGAPLVAIATLVHFRIANNFAVSCLSVAAIVGLVAMAWGIRTIYRTLGLLDRC